MQEDKTSKWVADSLRKQQEENPLPYELGAWEAFEAKRSTLAKKKPNYWLSGIAAALTLLVVAGGLWLSRENTESGNTQLSKQIALEEKSGETPVKEVEPSLSTTDIDASNDLADLSSEKSDERNRLSKSTSKATDQSKSKSQNLPRSTEASQLKTGMDSQEPEKKVNQAVIVEPLRTDISAKTGEALIASNEKSLEEKPAQPEKKQEEAAQPELSKEPLLNEEEIKEVLETKSSTNIAMGLSPGFGSSQGENATSGTSLGLGVMVDMEVTGKLVMGSGLAVNYLNQATESQNYNYGGANALAATVTETNEISQVQVDIPLYFKYPISRSGAISVQAGFSNLITFNQSAEQEASYTRQVAVLDAMTSNSFTLKSESVSQSQDLSVPNQKFYPFATANLGVNVRLFESKKTSYEVMPFYNYPLQEFSGYGEKLGMFGASFRVNFGAIQKK
ncbi:hypothetical protein [Algoriphagus sp. A40]|uniref:hypothetical protein n=1 Tax=Algoriphagus sp. A40 TaxID=1945863 RepID=UPI0009861F81|nr:hypothetical protein [Algoriphagus sp. A40]OOG78218.1 hypothetical protein B0E43_02080 [Algoriphagus sp. A40]